MRCKTDLIKQRPAVVSAIAYITGTLVGLRCEHQSVWFLPAGLVCLGAICLLLALRGRLWVFLLVFATAFFMAAGRTQHVDYDTVTAVEGVVCNDPESEATGADRVARYTFQFNLDRIRYGDEEWRSGAGKIRVDWYSGRYGRVPQYGERWILRGTPRVSESGGIVQRPRLTSGWNRSDFICAGGNWFVRECYKARRRASFYLSRGIEDRERAASVLQALLLGRRSGLAQSDMQIFAATGTLHILAISGLHVAILAAIIVFLLRRLCVSRIYWVLILAPLLVGYALATGARASALRACIMAVIFYLAPLAGRRPDALSSLAVAAMVILAWMPGQLLEVGFIYSFVVVSGLILLYPGLNGLIANVYRPDPLLPEEETPVSAGLGRLGLRYFLSLGAVSFAAWLMSAPLNAYFFQRIAPIAVLANLVAVPAAFLIIAAGCASLICGSVLLSAAAGINLLNCVIINALMGITGWLAQVPGGCFNVPQPHPGLICVWYALVALLMIGCKSRK